MPDPLPPPAPETRETILRAHDVEVMCWHAEGSTRKCEIGPHGTVEPESGEAIGYCGKCGWAAPLQRLAQSHEALRAALATERAARIAVEQCELCRCDGDHKQHGRAMICEYHYQLSRDECAELLERAEHAEASLAALTVERDALRTAVEAFLAKHDAVQPAVVGAFQMAAIHGMPYTGPNYAEESIALRALLVSRAAGHQGETDNG